MMTMAASVLYKKSSYLGFARKESWVQSASSILPNEVTEASGLPSILPWINAEIWVAVNCISISSSRNHKQTSTRSKTRSNQSYYENIYKFFKLKLLPEVAKVIFFNR